MDKITIDGVTHVKVRHVIDNYQHHTPLSLPTDGYMKRFGPRSRLRKRLQIEQRHNGQMSGLFIPEFNIDALIEWLSYRRTLKEYNEKGFAP